MSKSHTVSLDIMRAIQQLGPQVTNTELLTVGGRNCSIHTVKGRLSYLTREGFICREGKGVMRRLYVTALGQDLLDNPDACDDALVDSKSISKPEPERTHEAAMRACLSCHQNFRSEWPGHRICGRCRDTDRWRDGADITEYSVMRGAS